jgi:hypothetical protein
MSDSAADLADLAESLNEAEALEVGDCPSLAQVLWDELEQMHEAQREADAFTGFHGIA